MAGCHPDLEDRGRIGEITGWNFAVGVRYR